MNRTARAALVVCSIAFLVVGCDDERLPVGPAADDAAVPAAAALAALTCAADVRAGTLACAPPSSDAELASGVSALIVGGQNTFVTLDEVEGSVCYETGCPGGDPGEDIFQADVTVENLIPQALGTTDGASGHVEGVRVFFTDPPVCTDTDGDCGTVSVANEDGVALFTGGDQPYFQYGGTGGGGELGADGLLSEDETSAARSWQWSVPATVSTFEFTVYVSAAVQYPDGWVEVDDPTVALLAGGTRQLTATVLDVVGRPVAGTAVEWSSSDDGVATVDAATGEVTGAGAGMATITAASDGPQAPGTTAVAVGVILVDADVDGAATHDGESWATAFPTIEDAVAAAVPTTEIWIAEGTYTRSTEIVIAQDSIALYGGFAGVETTRSQRDWAANETIIAGSGPTNLLTIPDTVGGEMPDTIGGVRIDGLTFRDATESAVQTAGGLTVVNSLFTVNYNNSAGGGAIFITGGHTTVIGSVFRENGNATVKAVGDAVELDIVNSLFAENFFITGSANHGSALRVDDGAVATVTNSTFSGNTDAASTAGDAAVHVGGSGSTLTLRNSILWADTADTGIGELYVDAGADSLSIGNSILEGGLDGIEGDGAVTDLGGVLDVNPLFADADFRLAPGSPAIDAGDADALPADDFDLDGDEDVIEPVPLDLDGTPREVGADVDMGAYESQGTVTAPATIWYVSTAGSDANAGSSWGAAFATVGAALGVAQAGDAVWVEGGTYVISADVPLASGVAVYGGFAGNETSEYDLSERDFAANETVLTANESTISIFRADGTSGSTRVDGFTLVDARATAVRLSGGAVLTIAESRFLRNSVSSNGGALSVATGSHATVLNSTFAGNGASLGGAVSLAGDASASFINTVFLGNQAFNRGGAIFTDAGARLTITNGTFVENSAPGSGHAIRIDSFDDRATIMNSILWGDSITHADTVEVASGDSVVVTDTLLISAGATAAELVIGNSILEGGLDAIKLGSPTDAGGNSAAYPAFVLFPTAGADDIWGTADDVGSLRLQAGSSALDAGLNGALPWDGADLDHDGDVSETLPVDRVGAPRVVDAAGGGAIVDIGAREREGGG